MQKMSNGDYFDEKMRRGDRSKEARRISPPLKLLLKSPKLRGSTAPKSAHLHRGREQGDWCNNVLVLSCHAPGALHHVVVENQQTPNIAYLTSQAVSEITTHRQSSP